MKKWLSVLSFVCVSLILIASETRSLGAGTYFTSFKTTASLEAEGGNSLLWGISNQTSYQLSAEVTVSASGFTRKYSFPVTQFGSYGDMIFTEMGEPVRWKADGKISFSFYGNSNMDIAHFYIKPSRLEEDEGVDLPRP